MRASGILMPVFSLPGKYGIGCFSKEARKFVDFLVDAGQKYWQILPLGPTSYGDSPYQSFSTFAGNPYFIDLDQLAAEKLLSKNQINKIEFGTSESDIDYATLYKTRFEVLRIAYGKSEIAALPEFSEFCRENEEWLEDYALFMALKDRFGGVSFERWPDELRLRKPEALDASRNELAGEIEFYKFIQFKFFEQWKSLKAYANDKGIRIIGDIPIYVSSDSSDAWANPELFQVDEEGHPTKVAGCPPDGFSATGQLWGNPIYNWDYHEKTGYEWWISRMKKCCELYDVVRIDHFRGFDEYYAIPASDTTAEFGEWEPGPGMKLFDVINQSIPDMKVIAEDLGFITDGVRRLVRDCGYPNMKVLEFAFDARDSNEPSEFLPFCYDKNCVVYTGTHDNETLVSWVNHILPADRRMIREYVGNPGLKKSEIPDAIIRLAQSSTADMCIIPIQDYLGLGDEARINHPSTLGGNWRWRMTSGQMTKSLAKKIYQGTKTYGRLSV